MNKKVNFPKDKSGKPIKSVLSIRCHPDFIMQLSKRAEKIGTSLSAYCEMLLLTAEANLDKIENLEDELIRAKRDVVKGQVESKSTESIANKDIEEGILENPQLISLFQQIKGRKDLIRMPNGEVYNVIYSSPKDLLMAMIYSFHLEK